MNEKQYQDYRERFRGISMPILSGRQGEMQRSMMDDRKYGSVKENAILANARLMGLGQRLDTQEGSTAAWYKLDDLWSEMEEVVKGLSQLREPKDKREVKKKANL